MDLENSKEKQMSDEQNIENKEGEPIKIDFEIKQSDSDSDKYLEQLKRLQADFSNYKKRIEQQRVEWYETATRNVVTELLPVLDDFEYLFQHQDEQAISIDGVMLIYNKLLSVLKNIGVEPIETDDKVFDPELHEAVMMENVKDGESGRLLEVWQKGFLCKGKTCQAGKS